jgi:hypothetical protein
MRPNNNLKLIYRKWISMTWIDDFWIVYSVFSFYGDSIMTNQNFSFGKQCFSFQVMDVRVLLATTV